MTSEDIANIEQELEVSLPADLRDFLLAERDECDPDDTSILDDATSIIEMTREYRQGFVGLPVWPKNWVYLGDESDACPYYIDCASGALVRLHKGDLSQKPLDRYPNFSEYRKKTREEVARDLEAEKKPLTWKDTVRFYTPAAIAMLIFFVVMPLCAFGVKMLYQWIFK